MTLGEKIEAQRKRRGLSQEALAGAMGVSRQAVSKWESDQSAPDLDNLRRLAGFFQVSADDLLDPEADVSGDAPAAAEEEIDEGWHRTRAAFVIGLGNLAVGLLVSIVGYLTFQTALAVGVGILIQLFGVVAFEVLGSRRQGGSGEEKFRRWFYIAAAWLVLPFPLRGLAGLLAGLIPFPRSALWTDAAVLVLYLALGGAATWLLVRRGRKK